MEYPTLRNTVAKAFFNKALNGFMEIPKNQEFLNIECRGYWQDDLTGDWVAFDNAGGELYVEEFSQREEAIKYASGKLAVTKKGLKI